MSDTFERLQDIAGIPQSRRRSGGDPFGYGGGPPPAKRDEDKRRTRGVIGGVEALPPTILAGTALGRAINPNLTRRAPRYFDGDEFAPRSLSPAEVFQLQQAMASVGLLSGRFTPRVWDSSSASAYRSVLEYANQNDIDAGQALRQLATQVDEAGGLAEVDEFGNIQIGEEIINERPPLITQTTDPADLKRVFRRVTTEELGRGFGDDELGQMVQAYNQLEIQRQQQAYDLELEGGSVVQVPSPEAFIGEQLIEERPEELEEGRTINLVNEFMGLLGSPAWQGGQVGQFTGI